MVLSPQDILLRHSESVIPAERGRVGSKEARILILRTPQGNNPAMIIGDRLRELREEEKLSQGDIEKRTGMFRCYVSRVKNGHTVPGIDGGDGQPSVS